MSRDANPKREKDRNRQWYENNTEKAKENSRKWCEANPEKTQEARAGGEKRIQRERKSILVGGI
jgi:hypothetical protein